MNSQERPRDVAAAPGGAGPAAPSPAGGPRALPHPRKARAALRGSLSSWAFGKLVRERRKASALLFADPERARLPAGAFQTPEAILEAVSISAVQR